MDLVLVIKVQQFEDKRIAAKDSWNIKELKGKLSEIYPTSTEEQKLIYSGKLLNDTERLKDVLREYEGQEAHTVHLVFTPKSSKLPSKSDYKSNSEQASTPATGMSQAQPTQAPNMAQNDVRRRSNAVGTPLTNPPQQQQQPYQPNPNIPSNYLNAFYANTGATGVDANNLMSQQYAMHSWMQQAYTQYMNQYMSLLSSPEAFYQMNQQQPPQNPQNFAFVQPQIPFGSPLSAEPNATDTTQLRANNEEQPVQGVQPQAQPVADAQQRRFPNIIQDEQENRDWLDIMYSVSRLMILLCLIYFYSSPVRCLVVILIGISIYLYHIYKQNQNRTNNNNATRINLNNVDRPEPIVANPNGDDAAENARQRPEGDNNTPDQQLLNEAETAPVTLPDEPQVPLLTIVRTFVLSFFSSIIPEAPAL